MEKWKGGVRSGGLSVERVETQNFASPECGCHSIYCIYCFPFFLASWRLSVRLVCGCSMKSCSSCSALYWLFDERYTAARSEVSNFLNIVLKCVKVLPVWAKCRNFAGLKQHQGTFSQ